jgi:hypothetical protein
MATEALYPDASACKSSWRPIIVESHAKQPMSSAEFDPKRHLAYEAPSKVYTMEDIALPASQGISPIAVSEPFQLLTAEAVSRMRQEALSPEVMQNCQYSSNIAHCQLRGFANK